MFLGSFEPSFDLNSKRVALPKKIRDYLATSEIVLSFGFEKCLFGFDTKSWRKEASKQTDLPIFDKSARDIRRVFFSAAIIVKLDDQGRFVIPSALLQYAQITKPIIIGAGDHFEIWEEEIWKREFIKIQKKGKI